MPMRATVLAAVAGVALSVAAASGARASEPFFTPPSPVTYDWSGTYAGLTAGGTWGTFDSVYGAPGSRFDFDAQGFSFGVLGGVATQIDDFVFGVEIDASFSTLEDSRIVTGLPVTAESEWFSTLRGRAGYAFDRYLVYGTGGLAAGRVELSAPGGSESSTEFGWTIGAGLEASLTENFTARAEYLYTDLGTADVTVGGSPFTTEFDSHTVRAGVTYRFR